VSSAIDPVRARLRPCGAVTGIGSLPIPKPGDAIDFVVSFSPRIPFCPQPPSAHLAEDTLAQLDHRSEGSASWLEPFAHAVLAGAFPQAEALKSQLTGPITLAGLLSVRRGRPVSYESLTAIAEVVAEHAQAQVARLRLFGLPVLIYVDEPALALVGENELKGASVVLGGIFERIEASGGIPGIHCCATKSASSLASLSAEVVSFDATGQHIPVEDQSVLGDQAKIVSLGLISSAVAQERAGVTFSRWLARASQVSDPVDLAQRTIITSACGLGACTPGEAEAAFRSASAVTELVRKIALDTSPR
jgi:methionine synthase II (cobalamin-independent)